MFKEKIFLDKFENVDFQFCSTNWWPLIRIQVAYQLDLKNAKAFKLLPNHQELKQSKIAFTLKDRLKYFLYQFKKYKPIKNLIVTDFYHKIIELEKSKTKINPYTNPFLDVFDELQLDYTLLDIAANEFPSSFNANTLRKKYANKVRTAFNKDVKFQSQLKQLCVFLKETYGQDFDMQSHLVNNIVVNQTNYLVFLELLKKTKVQKVVLYCYYNNTMMSLIRAANKLNINTLEYQHSQVTSNHFAYSNWSTKSKNIQDFFPSALWVWRQSDADYLENQFKNIKNINYLVGGNLYLNSFKKVRTKKEEHGIKVLITLQGVGIPDYVIAVLEELPNLEYYLRLHPRYTQDKKVVEELKLKYGNQIEIEQSNTTHLFALFNEVDYHLTYFSGSAIEAAYFNVPNIIYGEKGYLTFKKEIDNNEFFFIEDSKDLKEILQNRVVNKVDNDKEIEDANILISHFIKMNYIK